MRRTLGMLLIALPFALDAQTVERHAISKHSLLVDGSASFTRRTSDDFAAPILTFSVAPTILYFVADGFALGGTTGLGYSKAGDSHTLGWSLGPAFRYYIADAKDKVLPFVGASVRFSRTSFGGTEAHASSRVVDGSAGITWLMSSHVGLTGEAFAQRTTQRLAGTGNPVNEVGQTTAGLRFGISAFVFERKQPCANDSTGAACGRSAEPADARIERRLRSKTDPEILLASSISSSQLNRLGESSRTFATVTLRAGRDLVADGPIRLTYLLDVIPLAISTRNPVHYETVPCPPMSACRPSVNPVTRTAVGFGLAPLGLRFHTPQDRPVSLAFEAGGGMLLFDRPIPDPNARRLNFIGTAGASVQFAVSKHTRVSGGILHHHTSNGGTAAFNPGLNAVMIQLGILRQR